MAYLLSPSPQLSRKTNATLFSYAICQRSQLSSKILITLQLIVLARRLLTTKVDGIFEQLEQFEQLKIVIYRIRNGKF
jgi:hypothetical protein